MFRLQGTCLVLILFFSLIYFSVHRRKSQMHRIYSLLLMFSIVNLIFDMITVYGVNHLKEMNPLLNHICHQIFIGSLVVVLFLTFAYILLLIQTDLGYPEQLRFYWYLPLLFSIGGVLFGPLRYRVTPEGNYSYGVAANMAYLSVGFYLLISIAVLLLKWNQINVRKRFVVMVALGSELIISVFQALHPLSLISGLGVTLLNLSFFFTVESPDIHLIELLQEERDRADRANLAKSSFLAHMSHEIRTPINAVLGMNEMILRETSEEPVREYAGDVKTAAQMLLSLINDILDISKIESGKLRLRPVEYDFCSFLHDLTGMVNVKVASKNLEFVLDVDQELPSKYIGDDIRLKQVLTNLLNNAVKYTEQGSVTLSVHGMKKGKYEFLEFAVVDTGIGIAQEDMSKLFEAFERIEETRNREIEGTGLGMNIAVQILQEMDSRLLVESEYGQGSTFSFVVRQEILSDAPVGDIRLHWKHQEAKVQHYQPSFCAPMAKVLVVDDNDINRKVFRGLLKETHIQVTDASSGAECLELVTKHHYDVIFLDHMMPDLDGVETLHRLKKMPDHCCKGTPVVILTANAVVGAREKYLEAGFDDFLSKPLHSERLEELLSALLPEHYLREPVSLEEHRKQSEIKFPVLAGMDWDYGRSHGLEDDILLEMVKEFCQSIPEEAACLEGLLDKIQEDVSWKEFHRKVHGLKGTAALLGAVYLSGLAAHLEQAAEQKNLEELQLLGPVLIQEYRNMRKIPDFIDCL